jgi:radical SAM protein with 4Fe4S-binding SPASM domain
MSSLKLDENVIVRHEAFGGLIYVKSNSGIYELNETAADILFLAEFSLSPVEIVTVLANVYGCDVEMLEPHITEFIQQLQQNRLLVPSDKCTELSLDAIGEKLANAKARVEGYYLSAPIEVDFFLTWACNLRCSHCFANCPHQPWRKTLSIDECKSIVDELARLRVFELVITGGEPLLHDGAIELASYAAQKGLVVCVTTNGVLIDEKVARELAASGVRQVQISIEGAIASVHDQICGVVGAFKAALKGIELLVANGIKVSVATILTKRNAHQILDIMRLVKNLGASLWNIQELKPFGAAAREEVLDLETRWRLLDEVTVEANRLGLRVAGENPFWFVRDEHAPAVHQLLERGSFAVEYGKCAASTGRRCSITPEGFVYPCEFFFDYHPQWVGGDLKEQSFEQIWNTSPVLKKFRDRTQQDMRGKCSHCEYYIVCGGKCRALSYLYHGDFYSPDPRCPRGAQSPNAGVGND